MFHLLRVPVETTPYIFPLISVIPRFLFECEQGNVISAHMSVGCVNIALVHERWAPGESSFIFCLLTFVFACRLHSLALAESKGTGLLPQSRTNLAMIAFFTVACRETSNNDELQKQTLWCSSSPKMQLHDVSSDIQPFRRPSGLFRDTMSSLLATCVRRVDELSMDPRQKAKVSDPPSNNYQRRRGGEPVRVPDEEFCIVCPPSKGFSSCIHIRTLTK